MRLLTEEEQRTLLWDNPARSRTAVRWSAADLALLDELADLVQRTPSLGHVVLDEAQDLSPMQLRAVGRRCATGSATVLGDIAQGTTPWATTSWADALAHLGKPDEPAGRARPGVPGAGRRHRLRRPPAAAHGPRAGLASVGAREPRAPRCRWGAVRWPRPGSRRDGRRAWPANPGRSGSSRRTTTWRRCRSPSRRRGIEHGVLGVDHGDVEHRVDLVPATVAKGLEFDHVVVVEPTAIAAAEPDHRTGLRRLYVVLTRAVSTLTILHARPLPRGAGRAVAGMPCRGRAPGDTVRHRAGRGLVPSGRCHTGWHARDRAHGVVEPGPDQPGARCLARAPRDGGQPTCWPAGTSRTGTTTG